jgi:hypothetical protein
MKSACLALLCILSICFQTKAQLRTPSPSPTQYIKQEFGLSTVELSYSRPNKKGRVVMGDLVPYGKVWRTGANQATVLTFGDEVIIGGKTVPAGKYGLLTIPEKASWTFILTKYVNVTSPDAYKNDSDIVRVSSPVVANKNNAETFSLQFTDVLATSCKLQLSWENVSVSLPIKTDIDAKVMAGIDQAMTSAKPPYFAAASYYYDNGKDIQKAKTWALKAVEADPKAFYVMHLLAKVQAKAGEKGAAIETAKKSIELSKEAKNSDYVRLNEKLIAGLANK